MRSVYSVGVRPVSPRIRTQNTPQSQYGRNGLGRTTPIPFSSYTLAPYSLHEKMERKQANDSIPLQQSRSVGRRENTKKVILRENEKPKL